MNSHRHDLEEHVLWRNTQCKNYPWLRLCVFLENIFTKFGVKQLKTFVNKRHNLRRSRSNHKFWSLNAKRKQASITRSALDCSETRTNESPKNLKLLSTWGRHASCAQSGTVTWLDSCHVLDWAWCGYYNIPKSRSTGHCGQWWRLRASRGVLSKMSSDTRTEMWHLRISLSQYVSVEMCWSEIESGETLLRRHLAFGRGMIATDSTSRNSHPSSECSDENIFANLTNLSNNFHFNIKVLTKHWIRCRIHVSKLVFQAHLHVTTVYIPYMYIIRYVYMYSSHAVTHVFVHFFALCNSFYIFSLNYFKLFPALSDILQVMIKLWCVLRVCFQ